MAPRRTKAAPDVLGGMRAYLASILDGSVVVSEWTRRAVRRHVADLERSKSAAFGYEWSEVQAVKAVVFCQLLRHVKGDLAGKPLDLHPWAVFFVASIFGWRCKGSGARRFRKAVAWLPRGNSKSTVLSAASIYAAFAEAGQADAFSLATTKEQAGICWGDAAAMIRASPEIRERLGIAVFTTAIVQASTNSSFKRMASRDSNLDGLNVSWAVIDELHEINRALWDVIETALGKRANSILVSISTAGLDSSSFGREQYLYCRQVLDGTVKDELTFTIIYEAPEGEDHYAESTMMAANPMWGLSVRPEIVKSAAEKARRFSGSRAAYLVKHLNVWQTAREAFFDILAFDRCADLTLRREDFAKDRCYVGLDLASRKAFACKALVFVRDEPHRNEGRATTRETERHWYVFLDSYLNQSALDESANDSFRAWAADGFLTITPGNVTDYGFIKRDITRDVSRFRVLAYVSDPYESGQLAQDVPKPQLFVEWPQRVQYMSPPMKELFAAMIEGRLHHDGNPALRYFVGNTQAKEDANENVFPRKERETDFIDGVSATLNAIGHAMASAKPAGPYSKDRKFVTL